MAPVEPDVGLVGMHGEDRAAHVEAAVHLGVRIRNVTARSNYRTDIDENRLILNYSLALF